MNSLMNSECEQSKLIWLDYEISTYDEILLSEYCTYCNYFISKDDMVNDICCKSCDYYNNYIECNYCYIAFKIDSSKEKQSEYCEKCLRQMSFECTECKKITLDYPDNEDLPLCSDIICRSLWREKTKSYIIRRNRDHDSDNDGYSEDYEVCYERRSLKDFFKLPRIIQYKEDVLCVLKSKKRNIFKRLPIEIINIIMNILIGN